MKLLLFYLEGGNTSVVLFRRANKERMFNKVLDDLTDEGYTNLNDTMEADFSCLTKLRAVLHRCGEAPFLIDHDRRVSAVTWQRC